MNKMLYKYPGKHKIHGDYFDYQVVEVEQKKSAEATKTALTKAVNAAKKEGWFETTDEAKAAAETPVK